MNFDSIPSKRKDEVTRIVESLVRATRTGASHAVVNKLSDLECKYAVHVGQNFGIRLETLQGIGKCLSCPCQSRAMNFG